MKWAQWTTAKVEEKKLEEGKEMTIYSDDLLIRASDNPEISLVQTKSSGTDFRNINLLR